MDWKNVGEWLLENGHDGARAIGSLITGNIPGAVAAGVDMVKRATVSSDPDAASVALKNPDVMLRLRELAAEQADSIRAYQLEIYNAQIKDQAASHHETQETIRHGDIAEDKFVRRTRPGLAWVFSFAAIGYAVLMKDQIDVVVLGMLMSYPMTYAGLRHSDKRIGLAAGPGMAQRLRGAVARVISP